MMPPGLCNHRPRFATHCNGKRWVSLAILSLLVTSPVRGQERDPETGPPENNDATSPRLIGPRILVRDAVHEFGPVRPDAVIEHAFKLTNPGTGAVEISRVEPPYGCRIVGAPPQLIQPRESAFLTLRLDPVALRGRFEKQVVLHTSDPSHDMVVLTLRGEMKRIIEVTPPSVGFGKIEKGDYRERIVTITNNGETPFDVDWDAPAPDAPFSCQLVSTIPGREYKLFVNTRPPYPTGATRQEIVLRTNVEAQKEIRLSAYAIVPDRFELSPAVVPVPSVSVRAETHAASATQFIQFNNYGEKPVRIVDVHTTDSAVQVSSFEINPGRRYRIVVTLPPNYRPPGSGASVLLKTDDESQPTLELPIGSPTSVAPRRAESPPAGHPAKTASAATPKIPALGMIGQGTPAMALTTLDGAPIGNTEFTFHPATVLNFFAANCGYSKKQIPKVEALRDQFERQGVRFVNVCETMRQPFTPDEVRGVMADLNSNLEIAMDPGNRIGRLFKVTGYPVLVIVRGDGVIDHVISGNKSDIVNVVTRKLTVLIASDAAGRGGSGTATSRPSIRSSTNAASP